MPESDSDFFAELASTITGAYSNYASWLWLQITEPFSATNYLSMLVIASAVVYLGEVFFPWRKEQKLIRKDFWLDTFYMFFNFFIFGLIAFAALSELGVFLLNNGFEAIGLKALDEYFGLQLTKSLSPWTHLLILFIVRDFIQWGIHRCLHRFDCLWRFHKVHHSVEEMGYAAHLRYHWMENIIYNSVQFIPLALLGYGLVDIFVVATISTCIGHLNHANINIRYGVLGYIFNNPRMHIWHHAIKSFEHARYGVNFGISLSCWDYIFGTAYIPSDGRDEALGFEGIENYPDKFISQSISGFTRTP